MEKGQYDSASEKLQQTFKENAPAPKVYQNKVKQNRQNKLFQSKQSKLNQELNGKSYEESIIPDKEKTRQSQSGIKDKNVKHNESADWIQKLAEEMI